jgi:glutamine synthetase adenylyltransferase
VFSMTNRLLGIVIAFALTSGIVAHAAQAPQRPLAPAGLPSATDLPAALQTTASHITETATSVIDPSGAIRDAYQRDHVALEHLRQQASQLKGSAHPAFNQFISDQEAALLEIERTALATSRPASSSTIAAMDQLVAAAQAELTRELSQPGSTKSNGSGQGGQLQGNGQYGKSHGANH